MPYLDTKAAELLFRHKVIRLLDKEGLLSQERIELLLSWQEHTGFSAHKAVAVEPEDPEAVERLARMSFDAKQRVLHYRRKRPGRFASAVEAFDPLEFLARLLMHVPEPRLLQSSSHPAPSPATLARAESNTLTLTRASPETARRSGA